jgi:hypothetical protein
MTSIVKGRVRKTKKKTTVAPPLKIIEDILYNYRIIQKKEEK